MDFKKEARKQYFKYFRIWFIVVAVLFVITVGAGVVNYIKSNAPRGNDSAPRERVYDNADLLTDDEEEKLRDYIAKMEKKYKADFVIYTFSQPVEGEEAKEQYGYRSANWEQNMRDIADDFWDENGYGYNKSFEGDGSILIDNRYEGQRGEMLTTSGFLIDELSDWDESEIYDAVDVYYDSNPYKAYKAYIDAVCSRLGGGILDSVGGGTYFLGSTLISIVIAGVYAFSHLGKNRAEKVPVNAYVAGGRPVTKNRRDDFIRKNVVKRHIETNSGGGGGSSRSGGSSVHRSSSGARHGGGGGRRH